MVVDSGEKGKESGIVEVVGFFFRYLVELMRVFKYFLEKECFLLLLLCLVDGELLL